MAITFGNIGLAEPSTVTNRVATVVIARGSTNEEQEILVLGDPESSLALARVTDTAPDSTHFGAVVRQVGYVAPSTGVAAVLRDRDSSTQVANVTNTTPASTAYALVVRDAIPQSTGTFSISSIAGRTLVDQNSTAWPVQVSTVAGRVLVDQNSTVWFTQARLHTSSGGALDGSTTRPAVGALALPVREVFPALDSTTVLVTSSNSTVTINLISSAAGLRQKVYAFVVTSTITTPSTFFFTSVGSSDNANADKWAFELGSGSSGVTGANLAISPPGWIFASDVANAIKARIESGSTGQIARVSLSWMSEA